MTTQEDATQEDATVPETTTQEPPVSEHDVVAGPNPPNFCIPRMEAV